MTQIENRRKQKTQSIEQVNAPSYGPGNMDELFMVTISDMESQLKSFVTIARIVKPNKEQLEHNTRTV